MKLPAPTNDTQDTLLALILNRSLTSIEEWRVVPGYEKEYEVSNIGRVRSITRHLPHWRGGKRVLNGKILKPSSTPRNYKFVSLGKDNVKLIHRLVALAFLPNPDKKPCVNHINGKPFDNNVSNLEWCTYSENELHSFRVLGKKPNKTGLGKSGLKNAESKPILCLCQDGRMIMFESSVFAAEAIKTDDTYIRKICRRSTKEGRFIDVKGFKLKQINRQDFEYFKNHFLKAS